MLIVTGCWFVLLAIWIVAAAAGTSAGKGTLRHMVAFKFKETVTPEQIKQVEDAFRALRTKIPQIISFEWGTNISPEKFDKGFTHGYILGFKNPKDRDSYLAHPEHKKFAEFAGPLLADIFVIDFQVKD
ncbi:MAG: Dabb family protein [Verrucomicrobia bacterium]|nr:Dabb family protein [Verrucomicrobiota bacterium]